MSSTTHHDLIARLRDETYISIATRNKIADALETLQRERDELKHDVERYIEISSEEATRADNMRRECDEAVLVPVALWRQMFGDATPEQAAALAAELGAQAAENQALMESIARSAGVPESAISTLTKPADRGNTRASTNANTAAAARR